MWRQDPSVILVGQHRARKRTPRCGLCICHGGPQALEKKQFVLQSRCLALPRPPLAPVTRIEPFGGMCLALNSQFAIYTV